MPGTRKISPAKRPFNPNYEDALAACKTALEPILREVLEIKAAITKGPKVLNMSQIKMEYGFSPYEIKRLQKEGRLTNLGKHRPKYSRTELDEIALSKKFTHKMSAV